jgi:hypothetical protein
MAGERDERYIWLLSLAYLPVYITNMLEVSRDLDLPVEKKEAGTECNRFPRVYI